MLNLRILWALQEKISLGSYISRIKIQIRSGYGGGVIKLPRNNMFQGKVQTKTIFKWQEKELAKSMVKEQRTEGGVGGKSIYWQEKKENSGCQKCAIN